MAKEISAGAIGGKQLVLFVLLQFRLLSNILWLLLLVVCFHFLDNSSYLLRIVFVLLLRLRVRNIRVLLSFVLLLYNMFLLCMVFVLFLLSNLLQLSNILR